MSPKKSRAQLDREIAEALHRRSHSAKKPLQGRAAKSPAARKPRKGSLKTAHATKRGKGNGKQEEILLVANDAALEQNFDRAAKVLTESKGSKPRAIATAFTTVTEESSRAGDYASRGWEDKEGDEIEVDTYDIEEALDKGSHTPVTDAIVKKAVSWLNDHGATEASSSSFGPGTWYETEFQMDYGLGEEKQEEFFLRNFTENEEKLIFEAFRRGDR